MPPIQQRLQLIRSCLELGETELLALQVEKLSAEALDADLQALVAVLQAGVYRQALPQLVDYLGRSQALVKFMGLNLTSQTCLMRQQIDGRMVGYMAACFFMGDAKSTGNSTIPAGLDA